jgi:DNA-binding beta-propeller fold protein YncE
LSGPLGVSLDAAGNLYITDSGNGVVRKVDSATNRIYTVAGGGKTTLTATGQTLGATGVFFARPSGVAIDPLGSVLVSKLGELTDLQDRAGSRGHRLSPVKRW